jgi:hypothetical protein
MDDISSIYNEWFFEEVKKSEMASSLNFANIVQKHLKFKSIIDVGCGSAIYLKAFNELKYDDVIGYDGSEFAVITSLLPDKTFVYDLRKPLILERKYDLAICIEVAEHIEEIHAKTLVDSLCRSSDIILFTAATIGQGGYGHINEQNHEYWIELFKQKEFKYNKKLSDTMRKEMYDCDVVWWIPKNLMIYKQIK